MAFEQGLMTSEVLKPEYPDGFCFAFGVAKALHSVGAVETTDLAFQA